MRRLRHLVLVAALGASTAASTAIAAGSDASRVHDARAHYEQAVAHYNLDEFAPALAEFREAYRLKPDPSFLFNIAQCHRKLGETDAALDFYRKYLRNLPNAPNRADIERLITDLRAQKANEVPTPAAVVVAPAPAPAPAPPALAPLETARADALVATPAPAPAATPAPVYQRWWFWTALGAVVAGAAITTYAATRPAPQPYQGTLDPHTFEVR